MAKLLPGGKYPTDVAGHLRITDDHVLSQMQDDLLGVDSPRHELASRILQRRFFRVLYDRRPEDLRRNVDAVSLVYGAARARYGDRFVARDTNIDPKKPESTEPSSLPFAVERDNGTIVSSIQLSQILGKVPKAVFDYVFVAPEILGEARDWLNANLETILAMKE
jgi:hypothetical protein